MLLMTNRCGDQGGRAYIPGSIPDHQLQFLTLSIPPTVGNA